MGRKCPFLGKIYDNIHIFLIKTKTNTGYSISNRPCRNNKEISGGCYEKSDYDRYGRNCIPADRMRESTARRWAGQQWTGIWDEAGGRWSAGRKFSDARQREVHTAYGTERQCQRAAGG